jgi:hypothetical protein
LDLHLTIVISPTICIQEQKKASVSPPVPLQPIQSVPEQHGSNLKNNGSNPGRPTVTSPQPLRALDRRPSASGIPRNRSPSSSTPFSEFAHQGMPVIGLLADESYCREQEEGSLIN